MLKRYRFFRSACSTRIEGSITNNCDTILKERQTANKPGYRLLRLIASQEHFFEL
jgi:hypothetical protein